MTVTVRAAAPETAARRAPALHAASCTVIIFGATGDLTRRKLMPALYSLQCLGGLTSQCEVIGIGRSSLSEDEFRTRGRFFLGSVADKVVRGASLPVLVYRPDGAPAAAPELRSSPP